MPAADAAGAGADVVVALTSYNDAPTIGAVVRAAREGLARAGGSYATRIVLADAGSTDGTREAARAAAGDGGLVEVEAPPFAALAELPYHGQPGRPGALRAILEAARDMGARACAFVDAGVDTVEPAWIERLVAPVLGDGFDYVSPSYVRRVNEGAVTKGIVYPLFRALYGARLRQPAAGEFGCSARLAAHFLEQTFWQADRAQAGIDLWLAVEAVCAGFRVCEAPMGARHAASRDAPADLSTVLAQVVGALFADLEHRVDVWQRTRGSTPVAVVGAAPGVVTAGPVDVDALLDSFRLGYRELREIWTYVLPPRSIVELRKLTEAAPGRFRVDDRLWASILYDFVIGYTFRVMPREHLLRSLTPLYTGWLASFLLELRDAAPDVVDARVEQLCVACEGGKRYLISRWRWPERLR